MTASGLTRKMNVSLRISRVVRPFPTITQALAIMHTLSGNYCGNHPPGWLEQRTAKTTEHRERYDLWEMEYPVTESLAAPFIKSVTTGNVLVCTCEEFWERFS